MSFTEYELVVWLQKFLVNGNQDLDHGEATPKVRLAVLHKCFECILTEFKSLCLQMIIF